MTERARLDPGFVPKLAAKARLRFDRHSGKHMIVYPERGLELSDSATEIVQRCDGTRTMQQIVDELATLHDVQASELEDDVHELITQLRAKGLLERCA